MGCQKPTRQPFRALFSAAGEKRDGAASAEPKSPTVARSCLRLREFNVRAAFMRKYPFRQHPITGFSSTGATITTQGDPGSSAQVPVWRPGTSGEIVPWRPADDSPVWIDYLKFNVLSGLPRGPTTALGRALRTEPPHPSIMQTSKMPENESPASFCCGEVRDTASPSRKGEWWSSMQWAVVKGTLTLEKKTTNEDVMRDYI